MGELDAIMELAKSAGKLQAELNEMGVGTKESQLEAENKRLREQVGTPTGWFVLLKRFGGDWQAIGCVSPFLQFDGSDDIPEDFEVALPIPEPDSIPEFLGW